MAYRQRFSLLIADDDESWRWTLRDIFEPAGFRTLLAANGQEAIALADRESVDCALFDMHMPDRTGLETFAEVRKSRGAIPCILVTADDSLHLRQQAKSLQVYSVLTKPVSRELVTITVREALRITFGNLDQSDILDG